MTVERIREIGFKNFLKGRWHEIYRLYLYKKYGFDRWHVIPIEFKEYAQYIINFASEEGNLGKVVEVGCGIGDVIGNIPCKKGIGFDIDGNVIKAAKHLYPKVVFFEGGFEKVRGLGKIDLLICVNVAQWLEPEYVKRELHEILTKNDVERILLDSVVNTEGTKNEYSYEWSEILPLENLHHRRSTDIGKKLEIWEKHI